MKDRQTGSYWSDWGIEASGADTSEDGVITYTYPGGWKRRVRANHPVRNNNPGNLKFSSDQAAKEAGALTRDKEGFGVFPDWITGKRAADNMWQSMRDGGYTIWTAVQRFTTTDRRTRIYDLLSKAKGWLDRDGKPVTQDTPLSKLTDEQFTALREYNNIQLEGWLNGLNEFFAKPEVATSEWIQTPADAGTKQPSATPGFRSPTRPRSSLEVPQSPDRPASVHGYTPRPAERTAETNRLLSPDTSQGFPTMPADPLAHYAATDFSPPPENPNTPGLYDMIRSNFLTTPSPLDSLFSGSGNQPQASPGPSGQPRAKPAGPAGQARKAPFYSLKDRLDFLGRVYTVAKPISDVTGLSLPFILAHAAHEVDFGKKIEGNNLFNLKADEKWRGPTQTRSNGAYRSYPSYEESMKDYLAYLQANPRYGKMFEPVTRASLGRLADAIHNAGYSDDPLYNLRILAAAKDPMMKQALWQYEHWPPKESL